MLGPLLINVAISMYWITRLSIFLFNICEVHCLFPLTYLLLKINLTSKNFSTWLKVEQVLLETFKIISSNPTKLIYKLLLKKKSHIISQYFTCPFNLHDCISASQTNLIKKKKKKSILYPSIN